VTPQFEQHFLDVIREHTAGDPQHEGVRWTNLTRGRIAQRMGEAVGVSVGRRVVKQLLRKHGFVYRKAQKRRSFKAAPYRNEQFEHIAAVKAQHVAAGHPVISIDTKKKELLGNFYREGKLLTRQPVETLDHDFPSHADGKVVPHGIYDLALNKGHVNLGVSGDTTEFARDSLERWRRKYGRHDYPHATQLLILCDGGGSNPARSWLFKQDLQTLANRLGLTLRVAHYPPYCSKYNPIEHRLFPHVTRACQGVIFKSVELVKELVENTQTSTGLKVTVDVLDKTYEAGRQIAADLQSTLRLTRDAVLGQWNYTLTPNST
jgi:hypothetical protein